MSDELTAPEALAELIQRRASAQAKLDQLEAERRAASEAREVARAALIKAEREDVGSTQRAKLERALADAEARAAERWPERIEGARHAIRDAQQQVQAFTAEHLDKLVAEREAEGAAVAAKLTSAAEAVVAAYHEREQIALELGQLCVLAGGRVRPGDVTFSRAGELTTAASALIMAGGEEPPRLRRDPRQPVHGALPESIPSTEPATAA
jgi:chromosome segregation ATPase